MTHDDMRLWLEAVQAARADSLFSLEGCYPFFDLWVDDLLLAAAVASLVPDPAAPAPVSYKAEVIADSSGQWTGNMLRFTTRGQAEAYARDLFSRWTLVREFRVVESSDPVTEVMRCNKCHRPMEGTTPNDGACECGGLIEGGPKGELWV